LISSSSETVAADHFCGIMRILKLVEKSLSFCQKHLFTLACDVWNNFIGTCFISYKPELHILSEEEFLFSSSDSFMFTHPVVSNLHQYELTADLDSK